MKSPSFFGQDIIQFLYGEDGMDGLWIEAFFVGTQGPQMAILLFWVASGYDQQFAMEKHDF